MHGVEPLGLGRIDAGATLDLVATSDTSALVHFGAGDGTFGPAIVIPGTDGAIFGAMGDLNLDTKPDLALALGQNGEMQIGVFLGIGDGTFATPVFYDPDGFSNLLLIGDADGDGKPDVLTTTQYPHGFKVLYGDGTGGLSPAEFFETSLRPIHLTLGDVNGDGLPDVIAANGQTDTVLVRSRTGGAPVRTRSDLWRAVARLARRGRGPGRRR